MAKTRLNTDDALRNIIGKSPDDQPRDAQPRGGPEKEKFIQASFYITEKHRKALKMRAALAEKPEDKDQSSIVRTALDAYLKDTLQSL